MEDGNVELYRYNDRSGRWKRVRINTDDKGNVFFSAEEGTKGQKDTRRITIKLSKEEIAYLAVRLWKMV